MAFGIFSKNKNYQQNDDSGKVASLFKKIRLNVNQTSGKTINRDFNSGPLAKTSTSVVPDVLYPGQILLANPYTTAIDIRQITFGSDVLQTIYMYNTGTFKQWTIGNQGNKLGSQPGQYTAASSRLNLFRDVSQVICSHTSSHRQDRP